VSILGPYPQAAATRSGLASIEWKSPPPNGILSRLAGKSPENELSAQLSTDDTFEELLEKAVACPENGG